MSWLNNATGRGAEHAPRPKAREELPLPDIEIQTVGLTKSFAGFLAVDKVDLSVRKGDIHALIGPNGAGKTTCFNLLTGAMPVTSGKIMLRDIDITKLSAVAVARLGLVRSFQISSIFDSFSVADNIRFALQRKRRTNFDFWRSEAVLTAHDDRVEELLQQVDLMPYRDRTSGELPYGRKRALEIATTLALDPEVLLLDEPTSGMGQEDIGRITSLLQEVRVGRTIIIVEHNLPVIETICDRVTVLARGAVLAEGTYAEVAANPEVTSAYIGTGHA